MPRKWCKIETHLLWKTNRKSCMAYRMVQLLVTLSEAESHFFCFKQVLTVTHNMNGKCTWVVI